jgi:hypothetical protein
MAQQAVVLGRLSLSMCLWVGTKAPRMHVHIAPVIQELRALLALLADPLLISCPWQSLAEGISERE